MHNEEEKEMRIRKESLAFLLIVRSGKRSCGRPAFVTIVSVLLLTAIIVTAVPESTRGQGENKEAAVGKDGYSISGRLLDKPGGKGVGGVTVSLSCEAGSATTADDGTYSITGLTPFSFSYWMTPAQSPGVWTDWIMVYLKDSDITDRDIYMTLPQSISGTVRDGKTGEPIAGAAIGISTEDGNRDGIQTDAQGRYLLYVRAREVVFSCGGKDGYCVLDENGKETDGLGKTITVGPGERIKGIDFELKWSPVFWGHVVYPDGSPASGAHVDALVRWDNRGGSGGGYSNGRIFHITTDDQGRFGGGMLVNGRIPNTQRPWTMHEIAEAALRVDWSKKYWLKRMERLGEAIKEEGTVLTDLHGVVALPDQSMAGYFKGEVIPNTHRFNTIEIVLGKSAQVTLHVVDPNGKPLNGAWIDAEGPPEFSWWVPDFLPWYTGEFESLDDGRYVMRKLIPGISYHVNVHTPAQHVKTDQLVLKPGESRDVNTVTMNWAKEVSIAGLMNQVRMGNHVTHAYERKIAAYLLGRMGSQAKAAVPELIAQLKIDLIADTRHRIAEALGRIGDARALEALREALKDDDENVRKAAEEGIRRIEQGQKAGSGDTKKVIEEVSVHRWQRERVENSAAEKNRGG